MPNVLIYNNPTSALMIIVEAASNPQASDSALSDVLGWDGRIAITSTIYLHLKYGSD